MIFRRRGSSPGPNRAVVASLRNSLGRDGRVVLLTNREPMLGAGFAGLAFGVFIVMDGVATGSFRGLFGPLWVSAILGLSGFGMAIVYRHPVVVDESGLHTGGARHFDIGWDSIEDVSVSRYAVARRWGRQVVLRVDPSRFAEQTQRPGLWLRLRVWLARAIGVHSFTIPPLQLAPEAVATFLQQEAHSTRPGGPVKGAVG